MGKSVGSSWMWCLVVARIINYHVWNVCFVSCWICAPVKLAGFLKKFAIPVWIWLVQFLVSLAPTGNISVALIC